MPRSGRRTRKTKKTKLLAETIKDDKNTSSNDEANEQQTESKLPEELLQVIISQLSLRDNIRASVVCKQWKAVAISVRRVDKPPWILFFKPLKGMYELYDPLHNKSYWLELPELYGSRVYYAKEGWLLLYKPITRAVFFYYPYTREKIALPNQDLGNQMVAFSSAPTSSSCIVFTVKPISGAVIAISSCHPGDSRWTTIIYLDSPPIVHSQCFKVVSCNNGIFYFLTAMGLLGFHGTHKKTWSYSFVPLPENFISNSGWKGKFMAEKNGDIFIVNICASLNPVIHKLDKTKRVWVEMKTLGGMSLFVSQFSSIAKMDLLGRTRNNIYFTKIRYFGKRCFSYSLDDCRYYPRKQGYECGEDDPFKWWVNPPQDLSVFQ